MSYEGHVIVELSGATAECEIISSVNYGCNAKPDLTQLPADMRIWIDFDERARKFELNNNYFTSYEDYSGCVAILEDDNTMTLRARKGDGNYIKYDGVNDNYTVGYMNHNGTKQLDHIGSRWKINKIILVEAD